MSFRARTKSLVKNSVLGFFQIVMLVKLELIKRTTKKIPKILVNYDNDLILYLQSANFDLDWSSFGLVIRSVVNCGGCRVKILIPEL